MVNEDTKQHDPQDIYNEEAYIALINEFDREKAELQQEIQVSHTNELMLWRLIGPQLLKQLNNDSGG